MPRLTKDPWFGPKRVVGWGWTPITAAGWLVTLATIVLVVASLTTLPRPFNALGVVAVALAFGAIAALTGTPPGGPREGPPDEPLPPLRQGH